MRDPYLVLGVPQNVDDEQVRAAYINAIKLTPPEWDMSHFETIRNAYEAIKDRRTRLAYSVLNDNMLTAIDLLDKAAPIQTGPQRPELELFTALLREEN
ncbi:hypothetical protein TI03_01905 [Achromatium sp. WMS1]|nr:hypothetical protein TI03_01905 [Achromatium sp. WMS1]